MRDAAAVAPTLSGARVTYVDPDPEFRTHRLCDTGTSWIKPVAGTVNAKTKAADIDPGSLHPTRDGQSSGYEAAFLATDVGQ